MKTKISQVRNLLSLGTLLIMTACGMPPSLDSIEYQSGVQSALKSKGGSTKAAKCPCEADFAKQWNAVTFGCKEVLACEHAGGVLVFHFEGFTDYGTASGRILCHTKGQTNGDIQDNDIFEEYYEES